MADYIIPTPRNPILGLLADAMMGGLAYMEDPRRTQQMRGVGGLLSDTGIAQTVDRLASGEPLTKGKGFATKMKPETAAAAMTLAPEAVPIGRAAMAAARATKGLPVGGAIVYHGSPYRFDRFDPTKIGSGEGAQAYGYGHYVAQAPGVAKAYKNALSHGRAPLEISLDGKPFPVPEINYSNPDPQQQQLSRIRTLLLQEGGDVDRAISRTYGDDVAALEKMRGRVSVGEPGSLYTIDLPDPAIARMLDYDRPFSQQTPEVRKMLQDAGIVGKDDWLISGMKGQEIYNRASFGAPVKLPLRQQDDQIFASQRLREAGIPGIRYLDQNSRGTGTGTSNFVVFPGEEDLLRILSVNGGLLSP